METKMCDIHAHIVYGVDDGARNIDMSLEMLRRACEQGARNIVCTPHSYGNIKQYFKNLKTLQIQTEKENIKINLYSGCEIYCDDDNIHRIIVELNIGKLPTINKTPYILVEFNPYASTSEIIYCVRQLQQQGYKIIIAHIERYPSLFAESKWIPLLQEMGCLFQINIYSIYDERKAQIKTFAQKLLKEKCVSFLGSDAHRTEHRPYMIKNGINYLHDYFDNKYIEDICYNNAEYILNIKKE